MLFSIRDDDTSYFTNPDDLERAYDFLDDNAVVSLSTIPFAFPYHKDTNPYNVEVDLKYYDIFENTELVDYLRNNVQNGKFEILLHGYSHEYRKIGNSWYSEMLWKSKGQLKRELACGKKHLEEMFNCRISTFVAPNNLITAKGIAVIEELGMNFSGTIWKKPDRKLDRYYLHNYIHRACYSLSHGFPYSGVYQYSKHKELYAHKIKDYEYIKRVYEECLSNGYNLVLYTHYWELNNNSQQKELLYKIYREALNEGFVMTSLSKCYE